MQYDYKSVWGSYAYDNENRFATDEELEKAFTEVSLSSKSPLYASGIPLHVNNGRCVVNNETLHTIVFGESGCKKTRSLVLPALSTMIMARESVFVTDVKGEISSNPVIQELLAANGCKSVCLDFRTFRGDGFDVLEYPFELYKSGEREEALAYTAQFISDLRSSYGGSPNDPYWENSAEQLLNALIHMLFDIASSNDDYKNIVNLLSVASFANGNALEELKDTVNRYFGDCTESSALMLKNVVNLPSSTRACVGSSTSSLLKDYIRQKNLTKMLSVSTFDVTKMYEEPTCVFLVIPDETTSYDHIAGLLLDSFYSRLIKKYSECYQNRSNPPCRINFVVDEFCNVHISDMSGKISASRSRAMRWYLFCQSKAQLDRAYERESSTIIGNCKNIVFLQSSDPSMLEYISNLCGKTYVTENSSPVALISADRLRSMKQTRDYKEGIFIRGSFKYHMMLPDFEMYRFRGLKGAGTVHNADRVSGVKLRCYSPRNLIFDLDNNLISVPFRKTRKRRAS